MADVELYDGVQLLGDQLGLGDPLFSHALRISSSLRSAATMMMMMMFHIPVAKQKTITTSIRTSSIFIFVSFQFIDGSSSCCQHISVIAVSCR